MFKEKYQKDNEKISADPAIRQYIKSKFKGEKMPARKKIPVTAYVAAALSVCLAVGVIFVSNGPKAPSYVVEENGIVTSLSYDSIYATLNAKIKAEKYEHFIGLFEEGFNLYAKGDMEAIAEDGVAGIDDGSSTGTNSSTTNNQVQGVDEADVVKNDGKYIYALRNGVLHIVEANNGKPKSVSTVKINDSQGWTTEFYVSENRVALIWVEQDNTKLRIYDTTDKTAPKLMDEVCQSGYVINSRMVGNTVYLLSNYTVYGKDIKKDKPETFVPCVGTKPIDAEDISMIEDFDYPSYLVISAIDVVSAKSTASESVLGGAENVYCNTEHLYYTFTKSEKKEEKGQSVRFNSTTVVKMALAPEDITLVSDGVVEGTPLNQFSMDEYKGNLRIVTTLDKTVQHDRGELASNALSDSIASVEYQQSNNLFVLDKNLNVIGSLTNLAENERVYSVRFDGEVGYFVTFRQVDPLFTVDLSKPETPKILSELKIPGFSEYLHPYGEGLLFGFGKSATENGLVTGLKLSMFDVSNPADVTEKYVASVKGSWSPASDNHKAIMVDSTKNIIAFATNDDFNGGRVYIYGYTPEKGFYERAEFDNGEYWIATARFLWIGDYFYVVSENEIFVYTMDIFAPTGSLELY